MPCPARRLIGIASVYGPLQTGVDARVTCDTLHESMDTPEGACYRGGSFYW